jgi:hypothetical protein
VGATPWRFKSSHPHSQIKRLRGPVVAQTMSNPLSTEVDPETFVRGFREAYARLGPSVGDMNTAPEDAFLPLFETLNWAAALSHLESAGRIQIDVVPEDLRGLRFARDRAHHHWGNALEVGDFLWPQPLVQTNRQGGSRLVGPTVVKAWLWVPASRLRGRRDDSGQDAYVERLEGQQAQGVLERLSAGLNPLR